MSRLVVARQAVLCLAASILVAIAGAAHAATASTLIVDAAYVRAAIDRGALLWDVRSTAEFRKAHLPGAINIDDAGQVLRDPNTEDFIDTPRIETIFSGVGLDPAKEVVVYATRGNPYAYFGLYTLEYFGGTRARVFHGGIDEWVGAGLPVEQGEGRRTPAAVRLTADPRRSVSTDELAARLNRGGLQLVDARTPAEFSGQDVRALRGGHIRGAVNVPYEQNWVDPETPQKLARRQVPDSSGMSLKSPEALKSLYANLDPEKETVVYCQSGVRAAETATVLRDLGFRDVKVFDSSWLAWGNRLELPAENQTFFNVGALNGRLGSMQRRIEELERQLSAARAAAARK